MWSEKILNIIPIFLNLLRFDLCTKMWSILENVPCALEKKVYYSAFGWNVLMISMRSISFNVSLKTCISLLIFCFDDLSIGVSGVLKIPTIIVLLSISPFMSVSVCLMYWGAPMLDASVHCNLSVMFDSMTTWTAAHQASLSITNSWSLSQLMSIELVMPPNYLIVYHPLFLSPSIFPSIRVFVNESVLHIRWPK